jgi:hypothetical protein
MDEVGIFTQEEADRIYDELRELCILLDDDPLSFGPKRLQDKTSKVQGMLGRCERVFLDISQKLQNNRRAYRIENATLMMAKKNLYATDPETRAGRSVADREAIAEGKLKDLVQKVHQLDVSVQDLEAIMIVIKAKRSDLRDTQGRLRDQLRLCQEEIGLGSHWGSRVLGADEIDSRYVAPVHTDHLDEIISKVDGEIHLQQVAQKIETEETEETEEKPKEVPQPTAKPAEVDAFLMGFEEKGIPEEQQKIPEIPKQDVLDDNTINSILASFESNE